MDFVKENLIFDAAAFIKIDGGGLMTNAKTKIANFVGHYDSEKGDSENEKSTRGEAICEVDCNRNNEID